MKKLINMKVFLLLIAFSTVVYSVCAQQQQSLDAIEKEGFNAGKAPFENELIQVKTSSTPMNQEEALIDVILDGTWQMVEGGSETERLSKTWTNTIPVEVPGSVHSALWKAGVIPDPYFGQNDSLARKESFKTWWYKKEFTVNGAVNHPKLVFGGVAVHCTVWLNGKRLGEHEGMFGGPEFDISKYLKKKNTLIVKIDPAPYLKGTVENSSAFFVGMNVGWRKTVVFNNVYGWHYSNIPSLGIWRPVKITNQAGVEIESVFIATEDTNGQMNLEVVLKKVSSPLKGELHVKITPDNFTGESTSFVYDVNSSAQNDTLRFSFKIPNAKLWWPNGLGEQNLYKLEASFLPKNNKVADYAQTIFGIRTIEMAPLPGGPYFDKYNWTFIINGEKHFVKGTGWCTMDALMNFSTERYDRFLSLAKQQHIQMLRAWGSGMPETDEFYDLCNRYGIMVMQEWPTAWDSHKDQPFDLLEETVRLNTIRMRNNPSLAMYGAGNESFDVAGKAIDMMGQYSIELDGTRPFHRGEPRGGSRHDYNVYWGGKHIDYNLKMKADFWGETGVASFPVKETIMRYLPDSEKNIWPPQPGSDFTHHTPVFNKMNDMGWLDRCSGYVMPNDNFDDYLFGSLFAQVVGVRHVLESSRARWPYCTGALYYKMNDNYPAASWSCVDWYGAPKPLHYFAQDAFAPVASVVLFDQTDFTTSDWDNYFPVYLLDDKLELANKNWEVNVRAFNHDLVEMKNMRFNEVDNYNQVNKIGELSLNTQQLRSLPLLIVSEVKVDGKLDYRTFYFMNFEKEKGCLLDLPKTTLSIETKGKTVILKNTGKFPAVGVNIQCPGQADKFSVSDNFFWLNPGEIKTVEVNITDNVIANAWNVE